MKKVFSWSAWSITTKIMVMFLSLSIISIGTIGTLAIINIRDMGSYALETSSSLGKRAIEDSTVHLTNMGEEIIKQKAIDVAKQVEMYLKMHPGMSLDDMRNDVELRQIVVQPVGKTGYTTLLDPLNTSIVIHKFPEQEKNLTALKYILPSFWSLLEESAGGTTTIGYYEWLEVDGSINQKFAAIEPINTPNGSLLTLWATTYIPEFSIPAEETEEEINAAIIDSSNYISENVTRVLDFFLVLFSLMIVIIIVLSLLLARVFTSPIQSLNRGAKAIGEGNFDYRLDIKSKDELGDLANTFNKMSVALSTYTAELKRTAAENIAKERKIQENLHSYVQKVSEAQEAERKRIARDLHDETAQALVVVARQLDDLAAGNSKISVQEIRKSIQKIIEGVRNYSQGLRPSILDDLGLVAAIKWLASDMSNNYNIEVNTEITGNQSLLQPETELMVFRVIQEALMNIKKHARATKVLIKLYYAENNIAVTVIDNGIGFEIPGRLDDFSVSGKLGLAGMQERVQLLGGIMSVISQPGQGTTIKIEVPV